MSENIGYINYINKFPIKCEKFFQLIDNINKEINNNHFEIYFNKSYNLKENSRQKINQYQFLIKINFNVIYHDYNSYPDKQNIYFIKYNNDDNIFLHNILSDTIITGSINDILYIINSNIMFYHMLKAMSTGHSIDFNLKKYINKFNKESEFIEYIRNNDEDIFNLFLYELSENKFSKKIQNEYMYLIHANNFDLI